MPRWYAERSEAGRAAHFSCYVDIVAPPEMGSGRVSLVDLDLDVAKTWDGNIVVLDEDEFAERAVSLSYPPEVVDAATEACRTVQGSLATNEPPFDGEHQRVCTEWFAIREAVRSANPHDR